MIKPEFTFSAELWADDGPNAWHFITLPGDVAQEVKFFYGTHTGFGTIRVTAKIADENWKTSLFPDKKSSSYLLPVKADVRKKADIQCGDTVSVTLSLSL